MSNSSIWSLDRTFSCATTPDQSGLGSDGIEGVIHKPQNSSITGALPSDCLVSYQDTCWGSLTPLQRCSWCILQPQPTEPLFSGSCSFSTWPCKTCPVGWLVPSPTSVLDMILNNLRVRLQSWSFGKCWVTLIFITPRSTLIHSGSIW